MISAKIVADSKSPQGHRITTMALTFPRFILAELNTHRMFSKNSASSRAIPFKKMVETVQTNPFIPIAWQKDHPGMQGTEYFIAPLYINMQKGNWLKARDHAVEQATYMYESGVTKQLCNRLLEPFMWHTVLCTATEWENFFALRCPQYEYMENSVIHHARSWKDYTKVANRLYTKGDNNMLNYGETPILGRLSVNKGQAEIHMMALAESMWDAMNESTPMQLQAGEWHIPFGDKIGDLVRYDVKHFTNNIHPKIKVATAMAARTSYTVVGDEKEISYERLIAIHDRMATQVPFHASPFEHCARTMNYNEYTSFYRGEMYPKTIGGDVDITANLEEENKGWCRNFRGWIQYRELIEGGLTS